MKQYYEALFLDLFIKQTSDNRMQYVFHSFAKQIAISFNIQDDRSTRGL